MSAPHTDLTTDALARPDMCCGILLALRHRSSLAVQSAVWVSAGTSPAPAVPRPDRDGFSMKNL